MALFGPKSAVFWPKIDFLWTASIFFATIMTGHQKDNIFVLIILLGKLQNWLENLIFKPILELAQQHDQHKYAFWCLVMMVTKKIGGCQQK